MKHTISLLIRADLDLEAIELIATGCLTEQTLPVLLEHVARARMLDPASPIRVDLTEARHLEAAIVAQLEERMAAPDPFSDGYLPVSLDLPAPLPRCAETVETSEEHAPAPLTGEDDQPSKSDEPASQPSMTSFPAPILAA